MIEAIVGMVGVIAGVLIGAVGEYFRVSVQFRRERQWEYFREQQKKLEELYSCAEAARTNVEAFAGKIAVYAFAGQTPEFTDSDMKPVPWGRIRLLVDLYAAELRPHFDSLYTEYEQHSRIVAKATLGKLDRDTVKRDLANASKQLGAKWDVFLAAVSKLAWELGSEMQSNVLGLRGAKRRAGNHTLPAFFLRLRARAGEA